MGQNSSQGKRGVPRKAANARRKAKYASYSVTGGRGERNRVRRLERHLKLNPDDASAKAALTEVRRHGLNRG